MNNRNIEREALVVARAIWGDKAIISCSDVDAQARSRADRVEVSVRGNTTEQATRRLLCLLLAYRSDP